LAQVFSRNPNSHEFADWSRGFLGYACSVLNLGNGAPGFLPALHSNQSAIEALFSWIRKVGRDRASNYTGGIVARNVIHTNTAEKVLTNNTMYLKEHIAVETYDLQDKELVLGRGLKEREKTLNKWLVLQKTVEYVFDSTSSCLGVYILPPTMMIENTDVRNLVLPVLKEKRLDNCHFLDFLLNDTVFKEFAMLSIGGDLEQ
jgi:hypothetical protein